MFYGTWEFTGIQILKFIKFYQNTAWLICFHIVNNIR